MPDRRDPPPTDEGWYALHDFRRIDWDAWHNASERRRKRALREIVDHLDTRLGVEDADEGGSACYSILGHKADLLLIHLRPTTAHIGALERQFEATEFAEFTERTRSFVSVTEASGYSETARDYFEDDAEADTGIATYIQSRLEPSIPDATHVCFYPMDKRRAPEQNWYDLSFEERAEHMEAHGDIGRDYGGRVVQMITGAIGLDDWEWGVTLWGDDLVDMKDLLYEMRFDPSTSRFADFGSFYVGRRFPPEDLPVLLDGGAIPSGEESTPSVLDAGAPGAGQDPSAHSASAGGASDGSHTHEEASGADTADHPGQAESDTQPHDEGPPSDGSAGETSAEEVDAEDIEGRLIQLGLNEGDEYEPDNYGVLLYSNADAKQLATEVDELRGHFEEYDTHVETVVRASGGQSAVASLWETERAADIAEGFLSELPDVTESVRGPLDGEGDTTTEEHTAEESPAIRDELEEEGVYAGQPHGEDIYALVLYSDAERETLQSEVEDLRDGFDRYDTHDGTSLYEDPDSGQFAIVSLWETQDAADTASGYLADLPEVAGWADETEGFGTMGMFYTVKPDHRDDFVEKFEEVGGLLADMDGHRETALMVNIVDDNDMFIASQWDSKDDAMTFFRSEEFSETVDWGRDILADKPRHVFLA